jgi:DNA repair exonuclease SbcCD ATPase subunit
MPAVDDRARSELRHLSARDAELSEHSAELRRLDEEVAAIRARAEMVDAFLSAYPEETARRASELRAAGQDLEHRRRELQDAEHAVSSADGDEAREHAERARIRAVDHVAVAQARVDRAQAAVSQIERDAAAVPAELPELLERAAGLPGLAPPADAQSLVGWASHAHAELFVALGQTDTQRERVIREANELASMLLGEETYGATVAQALARVDAHWVSSPGHVSESR